MHEALHRHIHSLNNRGNLGSRELTGKYKLRETHSLKKAGFLGRANVALRARMKLDRRNIHAQNAHILHNERIYAHAVEPGNHSLHIAQLAVVDDSIHRDINPRAKLMRKVHHAGNIIDAIAGGSSSASANAITVGFDGR